VERRGGRLGELRISVDGITAVEAPVFWRCATGWRGIRLE
jgi:hypothetical protein